MSCAPLSVIKKAKRFSPSGSAQFNYVVAQPVAAAVEPVPVVALDRCIPVESSSKIQMIKIDVEGNELDVLEGAKVLIAESRPVILVEANDVAGLADWLSNLGYLPYIYLPERRELAETSWSASAAGNIIALADTQLAAQRLRRVVSMGG